MTRSSLRNGHNTASKVESNTPDSGPVVSRTLETYYQKHEELRGIPAPLVRKAWFTMAHLLVRPGALVVDMGCNPMATYAMAVLNPQINFTGVDVNKKLIRGAQKAYQRPNLEFRYGDIKTHAGFEEGSVDAVINSFVLHEIFSVQKYSEKSVVSALEKHFALLKQEGQMFIHDFSMPPPEEYVLIEMPDVESKGKELENLSESDLLIWYAENARPYGDKICKGFFLEELPQRFPKTRLFRLPFKWAYEFIMRKDNRKEWETELPKEYTFFTPHEYRKNLRGLGARVLYTAPQWEDNIIKERFEGRFRLYSDEGKQLNTPPTSFIAVAQKMGEKKSLNLQEHRSSPTTENNIRITAMRNDTSGELFDIISCDTDSTEILPYRITENDELNIFIHEGLPRGIANAVPRTGKQLDGKRWSGHMTEAIAVPTEAVYETEQGEPKAIVLFSRDYLGLKPAMGSALEKGPSFYPAPDFIDEQIKTRFLHVTEHESPIELKNITRDLEGFATKGVIREISAQNILNAISVGYIPNARLETQILSLYEKLGMEAETWDECPLVIDEGTPKNQLDGKKFANTLAGEDKRFKDVKGTTGQLRAVKSTFVDEGWANDGIEGLASRDIEFVISDGQTVNKAVILPLTKDAQSGELMAGLSTEFMPVPQRHKGNGLTLRAPSITLPKEIDSIDQAKKFIAEQFDVTPDKVARLGESYFCHLSVTPTRIFPFCVATGGKGDSPLGGPVQYAPVDYIGIIIDMFDCWNEDLNVLYRCKVAFRDQAHDSEVAMNWSNGTNNLHEDTMNKNPATMNSTDMTGLGYTATENDNGLCAHKPK